MQDHVSTTSTEQQRVVLDSSDTFSVVVLFPTILDKLGIYVLQPFGNCWQYLNIVIGPF